MLCHPPQQPKLSPCAKPAGRSVIRTTPKVTTELYLLRQPFKVEAHHAGTMTVNRLVVLIGSILGLIGIVAWIGELDLGLEESVPATVEQPSDSQRRD